MGLFLLSIFGFLIYVTNRADCHNADPKLKTLPDEVQNIGETCWGNVSLKCNPSYIYRTLNGECSVLEVPFRGLVGSPLTRLLASNYKDQKREIAVQSDGKEFPSPRVLSNQFFSDLRDDDPENLDTVFTIAMMIWGQTITHDMIATPGKTGDSCCTDDFKVKPQPPKTCIPISIPAEDRFYKQFHKTCISVSRSLNTDDLNCSLTPILVTNLVTCFIDGSLVYSSSKDDDDKDIRLHKGGLLKFQSINGSMFPPNNEQSTKVCRLNTPTDVCFKTGDFRVNSHPLIGTLQTILLRLHNTLAEKLAILNPQWVDDVTLFEESRQILIAIMNQITYHDFLPNLIGKSYLEELKCGLLKDTGYNDVYEPEVNPQILTEFDIAFRVVHSCIRDKIVMYDEDRNPVGSWLFSDFYNTVDILVEDDNFEHLLIGMTKDPQSNLDRHFPTSILDLLFQVNGVGADLESIDIAKMRDRGISSYPNYLEMIGTPRPKTWEDLAKHIPDNELIERLKRLYSSVDDVEFFVGGVIEKDNPGSQVGPVFQAIIAEQFCRSQTGDRFHHEAKKRPHPFTKAQLEQIRKVTLSLLLCFTCPKLKNIQPDSFRQYTDTNKPIPCEDIIGTFSLDPWKQN